MDERSPRQRLIDNERAKITATAFNNTAVAAFVTGVIAPVASDLYGISAPKDPYWLSFILCRFAASALVHFGARQVLKGLTQ